MQRRIVFLIILNLVIILASLGIISHLSINASINKSRFSRPSGPSRSPTTGFSPSIPLLR